MGWTTALTAVANTPLTAGQWNASIRDNLMETTPALASVARGIFVTAGTNKIAEREIASDVVANQEETTSTSYTDLDTFGPEVTLVTGPSGLVWIKCNQFNSGGGTAHMSFAVSGETTTAAANNKARSSDGGAGTLTDSATVTALEVLNPGINTFTAKYLSSSVTSTFKYRHIIVMGL